MKQPKDEERLDKVVASQSAYSRKDVRRLLSRGQILLNGEVPKSADVKVNFNCDEVTVDGTPLALSKFCYLMMNKPKGVVCATEDRALPTVIDLIPEELRRKGLFPAGRLDKDTEGFVLITNDGDLAHRLLAPKSHVPKTYIAKLDKPFTEETAAAFAGGILLPPERPREKQQETAALKCMPAPLHAIDGDHTLARVVLRQGMYHQVRRMFAACGLVVLSLRREKIGGLLLDQSLLPGACRALSPEEVALLSQPEEK